MPDAGRSTLVAMAVAATATLALEMAEVRVLSYAIDPLLVYAAVSVALLGLGAGGMVVALRAREFDDVRPPAALAMALFGPTTIAVHAAFARLSPAISYTSGVFATALPIFALLVAPYLLAGVFFALVMSRHVAQVGKVYFANLAGSAIGCVVLLPLLRPIGVEVLLVVIAAAGAWSGVLLGWPIARVRRIALACAGLSTLAAPFAAYLFPFQPDPSDLYGMARAAVARHGAGADGAPAAPRREFAEWDPVSRVEVYAFPGAFGTVNGTASMRLFTQDGGAGSPLFDLRQSPDVARGLYEGTLWAAPYVVRPQPARVLIIGLGGAPDVLAALYHGARSITGVEINGSAIQLVRGPYADLLGRPYQQPNVTIEHRDGRSFIETATARGERWDLIQMAGVDTYSAATAGAFMFSENYLYTRDAFERYLEALTDDGVLSIQRFEHEGLRVVTTAMAAMRARGIDRPERHLVVLGQGITTTVLLSRPVVTADESRAIVAKVAAAQRDTPRITIPLFEAMGFWKGAPLEVLYAPDVATTSDIAQLVLAHAARKEAEVLARIPLDLSPVDDDRPFFFQFLGLRDLPRIFTAAPDDWFARGLRAHLSFLVVIALIAAALVLGPLALLRGGGLAPGGAARLIGYFAALGLGYLFVELMLMQRSALLLGHPTYSVATTLLALLTSSALGSLWAGRRPERPEQLARGAAFAAAALLLVAQVVLHPIFLRLLPLPLLARGAVLLVVTCPFGFAMGVPFPMGLRAIAAAGGPAVAWALGVNGFSSVLASLLAVPIAMWGGFTLLTLIATALYVTAGLLAPPEQPRR
jgi:hypothetical protein